MTTWDILVSGGVVYDGTGGSPFRADVGVIAGIIRAVGALNGGTARQVVDATDRVVRSFANIHNHSDLTLLSNPLAHSKARQGVTPEVVGNCGLGVARLVEEADAGAIRTAVSYLDSTLPSRGPGTPGRTTSRLWRRRGRPSMWRGWSATCRCTPASSDSTTDRPSPRTSTGCALCSRTRSMPEQS